VSALSYNKIFTLESKAFWKSIKQWYIGRLFRFASRLAVLGSRFGEWCFCPSWILLAPLTGVAPYVLSAFPATPSSGLNLRGSAVRLFCNCCNLLNDYYKLCRCFSLMPRMVADLVHLRWQYVSSGLDHLTRDVISSSDVLLLFLPVRIRYPVSHPQLMGV